MGRLNTRGRERQLMVGSILAVAVAMSFLPQASSVLVVAAALVGVALVETPFDIAFLTLRQRRTDPARYGSVFAVSMSLNVLGGPVGSALAGPLIGWSLTWALWAAVGATLLAAAVPIFAIPARDERQTA
jgi:predicted MFS family arabinose efflux permease